MNTEEKLPFSYVVTPQGQMNYLLGLFSADQQINAALYSQGRIVFELLEQALQLTLKIEPILGCSFVKEEIPYWKRQPEGLEGDNLSVCSITECDDSELENRILLFKKNATV
ncbi:hypothetical protein ABNC05_20920 [Paenibacillus larvae]